MPPIISCTSPLTDAVSNYDTLVLFLPTSTLTGYPGGPICSTTYSCSSRRRPNLSRTRQWLTRPIRNLTSGSLTATPLPAALPLFATGLGAMGLFGWRRKRQERCCYRSRLSKTPDRISERPEREATVSLLRLMLQRISLLLAHRDRYCAATECPLLEVLRPARDHVRNVETALSGLGAGAAECSPRVPKQNPQVGTLGGSCLAS